MIALPDLRPRLARDALGALVDAAGSGDDVAEFKVGPFKAVVVSHPDQAREVLVTRPDDFPKGRRQHAALRPVLGYGLLTSDAELHTRQRRLIQPSFVPAEIDRYVTTMAAEADASVAAWPTGTQDVVPLVNRLAMDIVGRMLFGRPMRDEGELAERIAVAFQWEMRAIASAALPAWVPTPGNLRMKRAVKAVDGRLLELSKDSSVTGAEPPPMIERLQFSTDSDGLQMPRQQFLDELRTVWGASHETSADAQMWAMDLLAHHPQIQQRLADEVSAVRPTGVITREDLHELPYASQVFKEAMRLYPPASTMMRSVRSATTLGGRKLSAGTLVFVSPYVMHRRDDLFSNSTTFDPSRFAPDREKEIPKHAYLPFGAGKRTCIGNYMALLEGQLLTATIAQQLSLEAVGPTPEAVLEINLRPAGPVALKLTRRTTEGA